MRQIALPPSAPSGNALGNGGRQPSAAERHRLLLLRRMSDNDEVAEAVRGHGSMPEVFLPSMDPQCPGALGIVSGAFDDEGSEGEADAEEREAIRLQRQGARRGGPGPHRTWTPCAVSRVPQPAPAAALPRVAVAQQVNRLAPVAGSTYRRRRSEAIRTAGLPLSAREPRGRQQSLIARAAAPAPAAGTQAARSARRSGQQRSASTNSTNRPACSGCGASVFNCRCASLQLTSVSTTRAAAATAAIASRLKQRIHHVDQ